MKIGLRPLLPSLHALIARQEDVVAPLAPIPVWIARAQVVDEQLDLRGLHAAARAF